MADFPCLPFWTDAYLADTKHLTTEEHGAYFLLLVHAWRMHDCSLPDDDMMLARHAGLSAAKWKAAKPIVMAFWSLDKRRQRWVQKRLKKERAKAVEKVRKAKDSAASRWNKTKSGDANADANASSKQSYPKPEPEPPEKASAFSERASAGKPKGFVVVRKTTDAINDLIKEIHHDAERIGIGHQSDGPDVPMLPAVRAGRS